MTSFGRMNLLYNLLDRMTSHPRASYLPLTVIPSQSQLQIIILCLLPSYTATGPGQKKRSTIHLITMSKHCQQILYFRPTFSHDRLAKHIA